MSDVASTDRRESGEDPGAFRWTREQVAAAVRQIRAAYAQRETPPDEGLRERKKRLTRQEISDVATWMFCERGFDAVRIAEIAREVGVSEKTVYNYFPTKESLVLDREAELTRRLRETLGDRRPGRSPTQAILAMIDAEVAYYGQVDPTAEPMILAFWDLVERTPALRTAMREMTARLVDVATEALAAQAQVDPRDPEPRIAGQALIALWDVQLTSRRRYVRDGVSGEALRDAIMGDTRRAARLLETGLCSFNAVVQGTDTRPQSADAAATNDARRQVVEAISQARAAWARLRGSSGA